MSTQPTLVSHPDTRPASGQSHPHESAAAQIAGAAAYIDDIAKICN